ncbi:hypothetical protein [Lysinibacillus fusiformis]|uniref:hypothetical protein n=1 Tax=Lysinibacillus fusiformis TaxID=28031 RepID=UPI00263B9FF2|nr:hypothetical protein [Lysinibacillus fusiformis]MDC6267744.1 hypothetical protein [Lysinibacillus sphaericus]MDN4967766.1 hypothetical protein [Lysinibacillus fusiformis]MDN4967822.1 hypothetical protein [Lysinibacillus fusiformis]
MSQFWSAKQGGYIKCPVEGCNHVGIVITNAHCRLEHGMTREEVSKKYGLPQNVSRLNKKQIKKILAEKGKSK